MINKLNPANYDEVANKQIYHSWQSIYWYKQGGKFFQHIDSYGELACFLILSKKGEDYIDGGLLFNKGYINTKVSYKEYERPFNLSSNKIENVTFKTGVVAFQLIEKKPENGYGFYNNGISFGFGFWSDLERGEKLSNSLEKNPKVDYFEVSLEPRFIYFIKKDFMLDIGYLFKSTKFGISSFGDTQQLQSQDTIHKINFVLGYKF